MRLDRLHRGEAIALIAAVLLFALMFFHWFGSQVPARAVRAAEAEFSEIRFFGEGEVIGAWGALGWKSAVLAVTIVCAVGAALLRLRGSSWRPAIPLDATVSVLGGLSTLLILLRILDPPDFGPAGGVIETNVLLPAFLGLAAAAGVAYGGYRAMGERGGSFAKIADGLSPKRVRPAKARKS